MPSDRASRTHSGPLSRPVSLPTVSLQELLILSLSIRVCVVRHWEVQLGGRREKLVDVHVYV